MHINLPEGAASLISKLEKSGFQAYVVGGCVRDSLLDIAPRDWDICTDAKPDEVIKCLEGYAIIPTGLKHGTLTVRTADGDYEVTTFRRDGEYSDGRRPDSVSFDADLRSDLERRDFTVNALAYNPRRGVIDFHNGINDLKNKIITCVGDPDRRFGEDALRIMRALRLVSVYGFNISKNIGDSILKNARLLSRVSGERKNAELCDFLTGQGCGLLLAEFAPAVAAVTAVIPEFQAAVGFDQHNRYHCYDVWEHTAHVIDNSPRRIIRRLAALFHDIAKPRCFTMDGRGVGHFYGHPEIGAEMTETIMKRLRFDVRTIETVRVLVKYHDMRISNDAVSVKKALGKTGVNNFYMLLDLKKADIQSQNPKYISRLSDIEKISRTAERIIAEKQCFRLSDLAVNGVTLISMGFAEGEQIGVILNDCLENVLNGSIDNTESSLIGYIAVKYGNGGNPRSD